MSAFVCSESDFATVAKFAIENGCQGIDRMGNPRRLARVANILAAENVRSVNYRYAHNPDAQETLTLLTGAQVKAAARDVSIIQVIKLCDCIEYQSCETDDYRKREAYNLLNTIRETAKAKVPGFSPQLPAYDSAAWGFTS